MLHRFLLRDFKGIRVLDKQLEFSKYNIIIGPSGAGKTSVLEGIFMVPPINTTVPLVGMTKGDILGGRERLCPSLVYRYHGIARLWGDIGGKNFEFILKCDAREGWPEVSGMVGGTAIDLSKEDVEKDSDSVDEALEKLELELGASPSSLSVYIPNDKYFFSLLERELAKDTVWLRVEKSGLSYRVVRDLVEKGALSERFTEATVRRSHIALRKETTKAVVYVYLSNLGEGLMRLLPVWMYLETAKPSIVLWDVVEAGLSPPLLRSALELLFSGDWQAIVTTHSLEVLKYVSSMQRTDVKIIQLSKSLDDSVKISEISAGELSEILAKNIDPRYVPLR